MNETRYVMTVTGDASLLTEFARAFESRLRDDTDDIFDEVRMPELPPPLIGFRHVNVWNASIHEAKLHVSYVGCDNYDTRPGEVLAASHPELEIAVTASREFEWEVCFSVTYRNGKQATAWEMHRNPVSAGTSDGVAEIVVGDRKIGAAVRFRDGLMGEDRDGVIIAINSSGEIKIEPIGPLDATTLKSLREYGQPENDSPRFPTAIYRRLR